MSREKDKKPCSFLTPRYSEYSLFSFAQGVESANETVDPPPPADVTEAYFRFMIVESRERTLRVYLIVE